MDTGGYGVRMMRHIWSVQAALVHETKYLLAAHVPNFKYDRIQNVFLVCKVAQRYLRYFKQIVDVSVYIGICATSILGRFKGDPKFAQCLRILVVSNER